ncbi:Clavaminate synthase-like protein [Coprinopsis marcescibilis]|uniref:Clavaminate synthase-like protein n=1 Tax=Coprinopsis marcescibilis TaxID=230819 RepID=A0A5C3L5H1_COPMA|nr:Clavaminate synthase-like protein [Coprinopsis marcescibilis]
MTVHSRPNLAHYAHPPPTQVDLDFAELPIVDLAKALSSPSEKRKWGAFVREAILNHGFLYVINAGLKPEETGRIFDIADVAFSQVGDQEKAQYVAKIKENGSFQGYKPRRFWHIDNGVRDQLEHYNINRDVNKRDHPLPLCPFVPEIGHFAKHNHLHIAYALLQLLAIGLELPEDAFVKLHNYAATGESYVRFMKYYPRTSEDEMKTSNVWLKGHTDFGTLTILYSQPVSGLQILDRSGDWKWVRHIDNALVINTGDALEFLSGGFYRATIHRVIQPPLDQQGYTRLGVFYFAMPDDDVVLEPLSESPLLKRVGIVRKNDVGPPPTMEKWRRGRTAAYGQSELKQSAASDGVEEEVINGVVVKHYR